MIEKRVVAECSQQVNRHIIASTAVQVETKYSRLRGDSLMAIREVILVASRDEGLLAYP